MNGANAIDIWRVFIRKPWAGQFIQPSHRRSVAFLHSTQIVNSNCWEEIFLIFIIALDNRD